MAALTTAGKNNALNPNDNSDFIILNPFGSMLLEDR